MVDALEVELVGKTHFDVDLVLQFVEFSNVDEHQVTKPNHAMLDVLSFEATSTRNSLDFSLAVSQ